MANNKELSQLTLDVYKPEGERQGYREGGFHPYGDGRDLPNGLRIQAYINETTKEVVIGVAGTTGKDDIGADSDYPLGGYHDQFREAVEYANDVRNEFAKRSNADEYSFSATGHSHGGGIAQVLAHIFGWDGSTYDAPPASAIIAAQEYQAHLVELGLEAKGVGDLINYTEQGSVVSFPVRSYVGEELELDLVPDGDSLLGAGLALLGSSPVGRIIGIEMFVEDQWGEGGQHGRRSTRNTTRRDPPMGQVTPLYG